MAECSGSCPIPDNNNEESPKILDITVGSDSIVSKMKSGKHSFYSDETERWGGKDRYPDPFDYIIGGMGACITTTLRQYADKHKIKLEKAQVILEYKYDLDSKTSPYIIEKKVILEGDLSDEERERLLLISNSPAQKMLERGIDVRDF